MEDYLTQHINKSFGDEVLSLALKSGDLDAFKQRLQILAKENRDWIISDNSNNRTMLHTACEFGHLDIVKFLIENGAIINKRDSGSFTPLLWALFKNQFIVARYLIDKGALSTTETVNEQEYSE